MSGPANDFLGKNNFIYTTLAARIIETRKIGTAEDWRFPGKGVFGPKMLRAEGTRAPPSSATPGGNAVVPASGIHV